MSQPNWKLLANMGDVNFADYGGMLVYVDQTGVYGPEAEFYFSEADFSDDAGGGEVYRVMLETGNEWWRRDLASVAATCGQDVAEYEADLASGDPLRIASVYRDLVAHHGPFEFDQYPLRLTEAEAQERYKNIGEAQEAFL